MTILPTLTTEQSTVYLASLALGTDTIQHIAQKANLPRSTTYLIIDALMKIGLISSSAKGKKTLFTSEPPEKLLTYIRQQELKLHEQQLDILKQMPMLKALENNRTNKPLISFYEGFEGIKTILEKTYSAKELLVICSGYQQPLDKQLEEYTYNEYLPKTNQLRIQTKEILTRDPDLERYMKEYGTKDHMFKISSRVPAREHLDKLIFRNTVALVDYDKLNGTLIEHTGIAGFERTLFEEIWRTL